MVSNNDFIVTFVVVVAVVVNVLISAIAVLFLCSLTAATFSLGLFRLQLLFLALRLCCRLYFLLVYFLVSGLS